MVALLVILLAVLGHSQTTYYVAMTGSDSSACGAQAAPCASINQVLTNYLGVSYTVNIAAGTYPTTPIEILDSAVVVFQGVGNPMITTAWRSGTFLTNSQVSHFEFRDLSITLSGGDESFTTFYTEGNVGGFYNVVLTYSGYTSSDFVDIYGGSLIVSNVTLANANFDSYFILDVSDDDDTNVTITGSTFTNLTIGEDGGFLVFDAYGAANIILDTTTFNGVEANYVFIGFWAEVTDQIVSITNNAFSNIYTYLPSIYIENDFQCVVYVSNTTWNNATADFVAGSLETLGSDDGVDHNITLIGLSFNNSSGPYAGALLVAFNSLNLTNSNFSNDQGQYGNDVVQALDSNSDQFGFSITNSHSTSSLPKAVVWNLSTDIITDISDLLDNPVPLAPLTREKIQASPKFGRKPRRN